MGLYNWFIIQINRSLIYNNILAITGVKKLRIAT